MIHTPAPWPYLDAHVDAFRETQRLQMIERRNRDALAAFTRNTPRRRWSEVTSN